MTPWSVARQASLSITNSWSLLKLMCIESVILFNHLILCCPLLLLPSIFPSIRVLSNESVLGIRGPKYRSFGFSISPPTEYSGLISFRMTGWISLQSKELSRVFSNTTVQKHQFFGALPSLWSNSLHDYWKKHSFTYMDLCQQSNAFAFNTLSRFVIAFLPRSKCLIISRLQSPSAVTLEPKKIKYLTVSIVSPSICHKVMGLDAMFLVFWMLSFKPTF